MNFNILNNLKLGQKLSIVVLLALLMTVLPFYQFYSASQEKINFANTELTGIEPARATIKLLEVLAAHRGLSTAALEGDDAAQKSAPCGRKKRC